MSKFVLGVSRWWLKNVIPLDMEISRLMVHPQKNRREKLNERSREEKKQESLMVTFHLLGPIEIGSSHAPTPKFNKYRGPDLNLQ